MAKAQLTLPGGTTVNIEGSAAEVAELIAQFGAAPAAASPRRKVASSKRRAPKADPAAKRRPAAKGPQDYIRELIAQDFFSAKQSIGDVKAKLEEQAHIYPVTSLSSPLFRLVRSRELRRLKEDGQWKYVNA